jgi:hypothetical protein
MLSTAASFKPSLEEVIDVQRFMVPAGMLSVQVAPESADVHMLPLKTPAPSFVPSLEEVMRIQYFALPTDVSSVQVAPESADVQMFSP